MTTPRISDRVAYAIKLVLDRRERQQRRIEAGLRAIDAIIDRHRTAENERSERE